MKHFSKDQKIILTGAGGHIGRFLLNALKNEGFRNVFPIYRKVDNSKLKNKKIEIDLTAQSFSTDVVNKFKNADVLINLAALVPKTSDFDENCSSTNSQIIKNLISLCPVNVFFLNCSTAEVYGPQKKYPIDESATCNPVTNYGKSKLAAEKILSEYAKKTPLFCYTNLRLTNVFGPGESIRRSTYLFIESALDGRSITLHGDGTQKRNYIYINDAVDLIISLIKQRVSGLPEVLNVANPRSFEIKDIVKAIKKAIPSLTVDFQENSYVADSVFDVKRIKQIVSLDNFIVLDDAIAKQVACMSKNLYFDLDGTLLNVNKRIYRSHQIAAQELGLSATSFRKYIYAKKNKLDESFFFHLSKKDEIFMKYDHVRRDCIERMDCLSLDILRPRVLKSLLFLKSKGYSLNLITARKNRENLDKQLDSLKLSKLFSSVILCEKKSSLDIQGLKPGVFFTDTDEDVRFGLNYGMYTVGIAGGMRTKSILKSASPDILCDSIFDALQVLGL